MKKIFFLAFCLIFITAAISGATSIPAPKISATPSSVNFGPVALGATSAPKIVTLKNTGTSALTINTINITGTDSIEFSQTNSCGTISAGGSCPVSVTFTPALPYAKKTALLTIASNDPKKPLLNVKLSGQVPPPKISATPGSLNFGKLPAGTVSSKQSVTVKNSGLSDLVISSIDIAGTDAGDFSETNNCGTVPDGGSCTIDVTFAPVVPNAGRSATLDITSNDPKKPTLILKLSGSVRGITISGIVSAPGGAIKAIGLKNMLARPLVSDALAPANAMAPVPHVTVNLVEIDNSGKQVAVLATATTNNSGKYSLTAPTGFPPATNLLVVAGSDTTLSSFVTNTTANINPYTQTTVALITDVVSSAGASLGSVSFANVAAVQEIVVQNIGNVPTNLTADQLVSALQTVIQNDPNSNNVVTSIVSSGTITGTVTDSNKVPLAGIKVLVRTFGLQVNQAFLRTDDSGNYTISVPPGDYIIAAINDTTTSTAASQWWTSTGGTIGRWGAEKVTVGATPVNIDFTLGNGGRISGIVTGGSSKIPLGGIVASLCDFGSQQTFIWSITSTNGKYSLNVPPGNYFIAFRNYMIDLPYGSGNYNSTIPGGAVNGSQAEKITVTAGGTVTANINLMDGGLLQGTVTDPGTGVVAGQCVRFHDSTGAYSEGVTTGADGTYSIWLQPNSYKVYARGQIANVTVTASPDTPVTQNFSASVSEITALIKDASGNPVSMAYTQLFSTTSPYPFLAYEFTNGDGSLIHYATPGSSVYLVIAVTDGQMIGSQDYNGKLHYPAHGDPITAPYDLGTITLPAGSVLTGKVVSASTGLPLANSCIQVRYEGYNTGYIFFTTRTMIDGSYTISLPAGVTVWCLVAFPWDYATDSRYAYTTNLAIGATGTITIAPTLSY